MLPLTAVSELPRLSAGDYLWTDQVLGPGVGPVKLLQTAALEGLISVQTGSLSLHLASNPFCRSLWEAKDISLRLGF